MFCEVCGSEIVDWRLDKDNALQKCPACEHIMRNLNIANCNSREHAWGGDSLFDKIRNYLTFMSVKNIKKDIINIFEIGFGSGWLLKKFYEINKQVSGVDKENLEIDIEQVVKDNGELYYGNAENFKIPENKYDAILAIHLVEHLLNPQKVFKNVYDGLKDDGFFYIMTPNGNSKGLKLFKSAWWNLEDPTHLRFYSEKSIKKALLDIGFKTIVIKKPLLDSMAVEVNSFIRLFALSSKNNGVLSSKLIKIIDILLLVPFLFIRLVMPSMRSSIEIIAQKSK